MSPNSTRLLATTAGVLVLMANGSRLGAQSETATIPVPLATALIAGGSPARAMRSPRYVVATLPPGWPADLVLPTPATVMGGMTSGSTLVAVFADSTRRLLVEYVGLLEGAGYRRPASPSTSGFQPALDAYSYYCRDSAMVNVRTIPGPQRSVLHVVYRPESALSCLAPEQTPPPADALVLPSLTPPPGTSSRGSGHGGGSDERTATTRLLGTSLDPAAVAAHYAAQLTAAGWTVSPPAANERVAVQALQARDKSGKPWSGALLVVRAGAALDVSLTMHREEAR